MCIRDSCIASIRVDGVGDQEIRGQITSGAQAEVAEVGVVPAQSAIGADEAGEAGRAGIGVPQPVVPRGTCLLYTSKEAAARERAREDLQIITIQGTSAAIAPVSYTHLDVYKRQALNRLTSTG